MTAFDLTRWKATHENGNIPTDELAEIVPPDFDADLQGPALMHPEAAWNYQRMRDAAKADGVVLSVSFSYRTFKVQEDKKKIQLAGGNLAATPGTSNHGWGTALDLNIDRRSDADFRPIPGDDTKRFNWLVRNAIRFGFHNDDAKSEPWHWDYEGGHPIEEDQMTPEEKAEFDAMKVTIAQHEKLIVALREGLGSEEEPARFEAAGRRVASSVRLTEEKER